jgi:hypothetical protein
MAKYTGCNPDVVGDEKDRRIAALEVAVRRGISQIERLLHYVMWDGLDGKQDEAHAHVTLELMREAVGKTTTKSPDTP